MSHSKHGIIIVIIYLHRFCVECIRHTHHLTFSTSCLHCLFGADISKHRLHSIHVCPLWLYAVAAAAVAAVIVICIRVQPHRPLQRCKTMTTTIRHYYLYFVFYLLLKLQQLHTTFVVTISTQHCTSLHVNHISLEIAILIFFFHHFLAFFVCWIRFLLPTRKAHS